MVKKKVRAVPVHARGGTDVHIHSFITWEINRNEWSPSITGHFTLGGNTQRHPMNRRMGGPRNRYGRLHEEKTLLPLPGIKPQFLGCPIPSH